MTATDGAAARSRIGHVAGLGAVAYVVLFIAALFWSEGDQPDTSSAPGKVIAYWQDSGHRDKVLFAWLLILIGVLGFVWFVAAVRHLMQAIDADGVLTTLAMLGGTLYAALVLTGASLGAAIKTMSDDTYRHEVYPPLIHAADDAGYVIHSAGGVGIGAMIIAIALATGRAGLIPGWARVVSIIVGVLAIFSVFFLPQILIALWLLVAGTLVYRARGATA